MPAARVLKAARSRRLPPANGCSAAPLRAQRARGPRRAVTPALIEAAQEGRQARLVCRHGPAGVRAGGARLRGEVFRHRGAHRAHRLGAAVRAAGAGVCQQHPRRSMSINASDACAFHRLEAQRLARALRAGRRGAVLSGRAPRRRRAVRDRARLCQRARLQHQSGEARGRAEELRGPARSEMEGQDREGASRPTAARS